jgi:DNA-binding response OmpR family regulator
VDDEAAIARLIQFLLKREGYETCAAADGIEALEQIESQSPDLILLDVTMPRLDGLSVRQRVRDNAATAKLPVIMLTGKTEIIPDPTGGIDYYLPKPFDPGELIALVRKLLPLDS